MYAFLASVMEPWDGPAALAMTDGRWAVAGMDRNALRPLRYTLTNDKLLIVGSESGMVLIPEASVRKKGRLGPGQMIAVDLERGELLEDRAIKDRIASAQDYGAAVKGFRSMADLPKAGKSTLPAFDRPELLRRQVAAGLTLEDMELILSPMAEDAKEAIGSMGDDTPLAVISDKPRHVAQFFRQNFSQVTNPPIDSLRERHVMSLKTRFANLGNILDQQGQSAHVLVIDSPVLIGDDWDRLRAYFGDSVASIDCTMATGRQRCRNLREAIARIRSEAEAAVRAGRSELFLSDEKISEKARRRRDGARRRCRPHPSGAQGAAQLCLDQRAFGRGARHSCICGADRRRRNHRPRLSGGSRDCRPPRTRTGRQIDPRAMPRQLSQGRRRRVAQNHRQNGHCGHLQLSRRL